MNSRLPKLTRYGSSDKNYNSSLSPFNRLKLYYPIKNRYQLSKVTPYSEISNSEKSIFERAFNITHNSNFSEAGRRLAAVLQYKNQCVLWVQYPTKPD